MSRGNQYFFGNGGRLVLPCSVISPSLGGVDAVAGGNADADSKSYLVMQESYPYLSQ